MKMCENMCPVRMESVTGVATATKETGLSKHSFHSEEAHLSCMRMFVIFAFVDPDTTFNMTTQRCTSPYLVGPL